MSKELESIENAKPSEALECLERIGDIKLSHTETCYNETKDDDCVETLVEYIDGILKDIYKEEFNTIKQVLLKQQEPKNYLKWEDLDFKEEVTYENVKMGEHIYELRYYKYKDSDKDFNGEYHYYYRKFVYLQGQLIECMKFFNDLRLERVEG